MNRRETALKLLEEAVDEQGSQLARYAFGTLRNLGYGNDDDALIQDILGEAFLTATHIIRANCGRIPDSAVGVGIWLRRIVSLKCLERMRKRTRDRTTRARFAEDLTVLEEESWLDLLEQSELEATVKSMFDEMNVRDHQILTMAFFENQTANDIGEALGLSASTVRQAKRRALKDLRRRLERIGG